MQHSGHSASFRIRSFTITTLLVSFALLVSAVHAGATPARNEAQRIVWSEAQGVILPPDAHFGASLCTARSGDFAFVGAPEGAALANLIVDGASWRTNNQRTSPAGAQPYACGSSGLTPTVVRGLLGFNGATDIVFEPGPVVVDDIDGGPVESVTAFGDSLAVGQPDFGIGGRVLIYNYTQQFGWRT